MKVVTGLVPIIKLVPRKYPLVTDTLSLIFENGFIIDFSWAIFKNTMEITLSDTSQFEQRGNYPFTILNGLDTIYKGKIIFLKDGTDVQNYTNDSQDNKRWQPINQ